MEILQYTVNFSLEFTYLVFLNAGAKLNPVNVTSGSMHSTLTEQISRWFSFKMKYVPLACNKFIIHNIQILGPKRSHWDTNREGAVCWKLNPRQSFLNYSNSVSNFHYPVQETRVTVFGGRTALTFWHLSASPHVKNAAAGQARRCYVLSLYL